MAVSSVPYVALITDDQVKQMATLNANVTVSTSMNAQIKIVQETRLRPLIGKKFYEQLMTQASTSTLSQANTVLLTDYIRPYLANWLLSDVLPHIWAPTREQGVVKQTGNYAQVVDSSEMNMNRNQYEKTAVAYELALKEFLCEHGNDFPLYCPVNASDHPSPNFFVC